MKDKGVRVDRLVREFRDEQGRLGDELEEYARRLGIKDMDAVDEIITDFLAYEIEYEEAKKKIEELARRSVGE
ncbi:MAG: hypothetical protein F7C34_03765 [Desulfurococcales archaeon]|nr:hypothetical protein [Desulfurococcales archaeon]